ncbi:unnamed protein product, partial [Tilletia caries]
APLISDQHHQTSSATLQSSTTYNSGVPGYAHPNSAGYTYGGSQPGFYPNPHLGVNAAAAPVPGAPGAYGGFSHPAGPAIHYLNPFEVKHRRRTTKTQFRVLEGTFKENPKPNAAVRKALAQQLDMPGRAVQIWFQNRRAKAKAQAKKEEQGTRERAATSEGSTSTSSKTQQQPQQHSRSVTAPQPMAGGGSSTDSYSTRSSATSHGNGGGGSGGGGSGDYHRHSQAQQQGPAGYSQAGHHASSHHGPSGSGAWHASHSSASRN